MQTVTASNWDIQQGDNSAWFLFYILCLCLFYQNLRKMEEESSEESNRDLIELQNTDWVGNKSPVSWPPASIDHFTHQSLSDLKGRGGLWTIKDQR